MSFTEEVSLERKADRRLKCGVRDWLLTVTDRDLAEEIDGEILADDANLSAVYRTMILPKYGFTGSLSAVSRHANRLCFCFRAAS